MPEQPAPSRIIYACRTLGVPDHDRCNALARQGASVLCLVWPQNKDYIWELPDDRAFKVVQVEVGRGSLLTRLGALCMLLREATLFRPGLIVVYGYHDPALFLLALLARIQGKLVLSMNDSKFDDYPRNLPREWGKSITLLPYHGILAASTRAADYAHFLGKRQTEIYRCAIDVERVKAGSISSYNKTRFDDRYFLMIARFVAKKNHKFLLATYEAYLAVAAEPRRLRLVGYGALQADIREAIDRSALLSRFVTIEGFKGTREVASLLGGALALLLPSIEEQFGIAATEALASGIPVVLTPACGAVDIVQSFVNGFVVGSDAIEGWMAALDCLSQDEARWNAMSRNASVSSHLAHVSVFTKALYRLVAHARRQQPPRDC